MKLPPIVIGGLAGLAVALLLAPATGTALGELAAARAERAKFAAVAAQPAAPPPLLAPGLGLHVADPAAGRAAILQRVRGLAQSGGVLVEEAGVAAAPEGVVALRIRLSGAEKAVVALSDALERGKPLMRLRTWRIEPIPEGGGVRLIGEVVAAWR
ncbi:GspMb/PilO family protein [Sphingomonas sp. OTU376]|uniref:GspMb/PilO family protein n=1 Tax=Sphingomonas sp. OTU376 TaxID=3043863 RepID=UPI00313B9B1E